MVDLCIRNDSDAALKDLAIEIGMPALPGLDVADRIYTNPFDRRAANDSSHSSYPEVERRGGAIFVRTTIGAIAANETQSLLGTSLRFAVKDKALGRKLALSYKLRSADGQKLCDGRVKLRFSEAAA